MHGGRLFAAIVWAVAAAGTGWTQDKGCVTDEVLEQVAVDLEGPIDVQQPLVDCSDGRPDDDCLSGRQGSDQATQQCGGMSVVFGTGNCSVHCADGYYACGKCGWGGFAMCTCRPNYTCDPHRP